MACRDVAGCEGGVSIDVVCVGTYLPTLLSGVGGSGYSILVDIL